MSRDVARRGRGAVPGTESKDTQLARFGLAIMILLQAPLFGINVGPPFDPAAGHLPSPSSYKHMSALEVTAITAPPGFQYYLYMLLVPGAVFKEAMKTGINCLGSFSDPQCQTDLRTIIQRGLAGAEATMSDEARLEWEKVVGGPVWGGNSGSSSNEAGGNVTTEGSKGAPRTWAEWLTRHKILAGPSGIIAIGGLTCFFSSFSPMPFAAAGLVLAVLVSAPATLILPGLLFLLFLATMMVLGDHRPLKFPKKTKTHTD